MFASFQGLHTSTSLRPGASSSSSSTRDSTSTPVHMRRMSTPRVESPRLDSYRYSLINLEETLENDLGKFTYVSYLITYYVTHYQNLIMAAQSLEKIAFLFAVMGFWKAFLKFISDVFISMCVTKVFRKRNMLKMPSSILDMAYLKPDQIHEFS